ncbi:heparinase II/III family protein [Microlunatus soli]|uniref:Heparinase II/III-like protein n=1 Tax=Microlunatus soli TaxID=630515 RepID=A0A1H1R7K6_9ACTN|nr:heparinase II/III family protein [Microlunatus soli]SDS31757.1 Heparinase II/III-like protein [Microlunatus soli]
MTATTAIEKPAHIDDRIRHLDTADLIVACGEPDGVSDLETLRRWVGGRMQRPAWPLPEWASAVRGTADADAIVASAAPLLGSIDVTGAAEGRSRRYGFHYLGWLRAGVSAWLLTADHRYLDGFDRHLVRWQAERDAVSGDWPGLDVIWYSLGTWARCHNLLPALEILTRSPVSDEAWQALFATLIGGARWAHDEHDSFRHGNWQLASAAELLHIGSVLPDLPEAAAWRERGRRRLAEHLILDVYPDGGHYERSPGYHTMCLDAVQTALMIDQRYGGGLLDDAEFKTRIRAMHDWLIDLADPTGWLPHLQDSGLVWAGRHLLRGGYLLDALDLVNHARGWMDPEQFATEAAQLPAHADADRGQRWQRAVGSPSTPPTRPSSRLLPESGYAIARTGGSTDDLQVVINVGPHIEHELESHSHQAVLDLVLSGWGRPLLWEAGGPPSYDVDDYRSWFQSGRGHNTVLVDDGECGTERDARCHRFTDTPPLPVGSDPTAGRVTVFTGSHRGNGLYQQRTILLIRDRPGYLIILDSAADDHDHRFELRLQALTGWQQIDGPPEAEMLLFEAVDDTGPGLHVAEVGDPGGSTIQQQTGTARRPLPVTRSSEYGPLHTLAVGRDNGSFRTVLWPLATSSSTRPVITTDGDSLIIRTADRVDRIGPSQWSRNDQSVWEAAGWDTDRLNDDAGPLIRTDGPAMLSAIVANGLLTLVIDCATRSRVRLRDSWRRVTLDDIVVPAASTADGTELTLPYAGRWTITGVRDV